MKTTIAVVFDFDETLAPDTTSSFLNSFGVDVRDFWKNRAQSLIDAGWDPIPAYLYLMIKESEARPAGKRITREALSKWGPRIKLYNGVTRIFGRIEKHAQSIDAEARVEFYVISSGIGEIVRSTKIARYFTEIWASDFEYNAVEEIMFPKKVISFTDKTRYLFHISKGIIGPQSHSTPFEVNKKIPEEDFRIPFNQIIYLGDGFTDIPCFSLVRRQGGIAIGVYDQEDREKWGKAWGFVEDGRVSNLVPADYGQNSALVNSLLMAVGAIANRISLRKKTYQG
ncbi:MAG: haloacid dehalogenase-like hydrolase [Acidobacteria bacterium]|nr:haloacid dehalogenase-like hydrolase [Acidobacteriota bacterium]MBI3655811.1 haloacid dehalogenase-like hydrolase [Acidobacteriota bacterium]